MPRTYSIPSFSVPPSLPLHAPAIWNGKPSLLFSALHVWPLLLDPAGGMPQQLIHLDSAILRLFAEKSFTTDDHCHSRDGVEG